MNSIKVVLLFAFIASANCLISDDIHSLVSNNKQCNQSESALDSLGIKICETSGDRGSGDVLCNGIKSVIQDVCNENSSIALAQVKDSSKFDDSLDAFCGKVGSLNALVKLPKNVSDTLNNMKNKSCLFLCASTDGLLNPLCPFLISYVELKNSLVPKNVTVPKIIPVVQPAPAIAVQNTVNQTKPVEKPLDKAKQNQEPDNIKEQSKDINKAYDPKQSIPEVVSSPEASPNRPSDSVDNPSNPIGNSEIETDGLQPPENDGIEETDNMEFGGKQSEDIKDDKKSNVEGVDHANELENGQSKAAEQESVKITSAEREPFDEAESSHFFTYFVFISALCIFFYVAMYNKKKILALMIEGRRSSVKRRPNSAAYSKLDCTLEEAMASGPSTSSSNTLLY